MASAWISRYATSSGERRFRVLFRLGGRERRHDTAGGAGETSVDRGRACEPPRAGPAPHHADEPHHARRPRRALAVEPRRRLRRDTCDVPRCARPAASPDRHDCTREDRCCHGCRTRRLASRAKLRKQTIRKTVSVLRLCSTRGFQPNPARDRQTVTLPREKRRQVEPPTAEHVEAVVRLLPRPYRLPTLVLDATGMRVAELERLTWGDVDEPRCRWRVTAAKTGCARWVQVPEQLFQAVTRLVAREDRVPE